ncbi:MAG TPA: hypothetical protein VGI19_11085 [Candidatus Cybelea sp.]|jgi:hypothetical protein
MEKFDPARATALGTLALFLTACGGSLQSQSFTAPQSRISESVSDASGHSTSDLLYAVTDANIAYVISYPDGKLSQTLTFASEGAGTGACSDANGNVFITAVDAAPTNGYIYEFSHGGTAPINTINEGNSTPAGCSVDKSTDNLAVANNDNGNCTGGNVAIYKNASGQPQTYTIPGFQCYTAAAYDRRGDLFIGGKGYSSSSPYEIAELPPGSSQFENIVLSQSIGCFGTCVNHIEWDGTDLTVVEPTTHHTSPQVYRISISGSKGTIVGTIQLKGRWGKYSGEGASIDGAKILLDYRPGSIATWKYPQGGAAQILIKGLEHFAKPGLTLSRG